MINLSRSACSLARTPSRHPSTCSTSSSKNWDSSLRPRVLETYIRVKAKNVRSKGALFGRTVLLSTFHIARGRVKLQHSYPGCFLLLELKIVSRPGGLRFPGRSQTFNKASPMFSSQNRGRTTIQDWNISLRRRSCR
jgi:hypothetical protein